MALKAILESLEGLDESIAAEYVKDEDNGGYKLDACVETQIHNRFSGVVLSSLSGLRVCEM